METAGAGSDCNHTNTICDQAAYVHGCLTNGDKQRWTCNNSPGRCDSVRDTDTNTDRTLILTRTLILIMILIMTLIQIPVLIQACCKFPALQSRIPVVMGHKVAVRTL